MSDSTKRNASKKEPPQMLAYDGIGRAAERGVASPIRHFLFFLFLLLFFHRLLFLIEFLPVSFIKKKRKEKKRN